MALGPSQRAGTGVGKGDPAWKTVPTIWPLSLMLEAQLPPKGTGAGGKGRIVGARASGPSQKAGTAVGKNNPAWSTNPTIWPLSLMLEAPPPPDPNGPGGRRGKGRIVGTVACGPSQKAGTWVGRPNKAPTVATEPTIWPFSLMLEAVPPPGANSPAGRGGGGRSGR